MALREQHDSDRQRHPGADARLAGNIAMAVEPDEFGRAAADIEQKNAVGIGIGERRAAERGQARFRCAVDDFERKPGLGEDARRNSSPFSASRQASVAIRRARLTPRAAICRGRSSALRRRGEIAFGGQSPAAAETFAQPHDTQKGVDDAKAVPDRARDEEAAIIGSEVERCVESRLTRRPVRGVRKAAPLPSSGAGPGRRMLFLLTGRSHVAAPAPTA